MKLELEIEIISIFKESQTSDEAQIIANNFGNARKIVVNRLGYVCNRRCVAPRVMSDMKRAGLIVPDGKHWVLGPKDVVKKRLMHLKRITQHPSSDGVQQKFVDMLDNLMKAPEPVAAIA